jgi:diguanylate cyclase (GGDEF)-like protein
VKENTKVSGSNSESGLAIRAVLGIIGVVFAIEVVLVAVFGSFEYVQSTVVVLIAGVLLALLAAPPIYWLVSIPIRREYAKRLAAEATAADLSQLVITDSLTRIMNRRGITVALLDSMAQAERYNTPLTVAMADIDLFRKVNDEHGRETGDSVLRGVARALEEALRMPDKVGRFGTEEFMILLPHTPLVQGRKIADRIRVAVGKRPQQHYGAKISVTVSLGVTQFRKGEDLQQLLSRVENALTDAKTEGRNCVIARKA